MAMPRRFRLEKSIAALLQESLIERNSQSDTITCHRLVQAAVRNGMDPSRKAEVFARGVVLLDAVFPEQNAGAHLLGKWADCEPFCPQVSSLLAVCLQFQEELPYRILLCETVRRCAWFLFERAQFEEAARMIDQACSICASALESGDHPGYRGTYITWLTADLYGMRHSIAYEKNAVGHGLEMAQRVKSIRESVPKPATPEYELWTLASDCGIAVSLMAENRASEALPLLQGLVKFIRDHEDQIQGGVEVSMDVFLQNLCLCHLMLGQVDDAMECWEESAAMTESKHGVDSLAMAV